MRWMYRVKLLIECPLSDIYDIIIYYILANYRARAYDTRYANIKYSRNYKEQKARAITGMPLIRLLRFHFET